MFQRVSKPASRICTSKQGEAASRQDDLSFVDKKKDDQAIRTGSPGNDELMIDIDALNLSASVDAITRMHARSYVRNGRSMLNVQVSLGARVRCGALCMSPELDLSTRASSPSQVPNPADGSTNGS